MKNLDFLFIALCVFTFTLAAAALLLASAAVGSVPGVLLGAACAVAAVGFLTLGVRRVFNI